MLPTAVDVDITVTGSWTGPDGTQVINSTRTTILPLMEVASYMYRSVLMFDPIDDSDKGNYSCSVSVQSRNPSLYVGSMNSEFINMNVLSEFNQNLINIIIDNFFFSSH